MNLDVNSKHFSRLMEVARERQKEVGTIIIPSLRRCGCCQNKFSLENFPVLPATELVRGGLDLVCQKCTTDYKEELKDLCRLMCAGCNEVIQVFEPGPAKAGFVFQKGGIYHVANCPACLNPPPEKSPILEMILFYKRHGIPYD